MRSITFLTLLVLTGCGLASDAPRKLEPGEAAPLVTGKKVQLLDVRTEEEWNEGRLDGAVRVEIGSRDFTTQVKANLDESQPVLVYCRSGRRSARATDKLEAMGFKTVYDLKGGILAWTKDGQKVVK